MFTQCSGRCPTLWRPESRIKTAGFTCGRKVLLSPALIPQRTNCGGHVVGRDEGDLVVRVIRAKLHGVRVTSADLHYHGSITLDPEHCDQAGIYPTEFVEIWNKNSGARLTTYVIFGAPGSRCCVLNGAAARTCQVGDELIIAAAADVKPEELYAIRPRVVTFTPNNEIDQIVRK